MFSLPVNELVETAVRLASWGQHVSITLWKEAPWSSEAYDYTVLQRLWQKGTITELNTYTSTRLPRKDDSKLFSKLPTKVFVSQKVAIDFIFSDHQDLLI